MTISLRLSDEDSKLIKDYAQINNMSISDLVRQAVIEKIENEIDLEAYNKALKNFKKNPKTYTLDEIKEYINQERKTGFRYGDKYKSHDLIPSFNLAD